MHGDLAASSGTGGQASRRGLGLFVRRQLGLWTHWQPWLALIGIGCIAGLLLSEFVWSFDIGFFNTTVGGYFASVEHWHGADWTTLPDQRDLAFLLCFSLVVASWSWASGFVLGSLSGHTIWLTGTLFYLTVIDSFPVIRGIIPLKGAVAQPLGFLVHLRPFGIAQWLLFVVPVLCGMRSGLRRHTLPIAQTIIVALIIAIFTSVLTAMSISFYGIDAAWGSPAFNWKTALLSWPVAYMLATARRRSLEMHVSTTIRLL
jgi:hypothetical protein